MYTCLTKIKDVLNYQFHEDKIVLLKGNHKEAYLTLVDTNFVEKDSFKESTAYDFELFKNHIILTSQKAVMSYSLEFENVFLKPNRLDYILHIKGVRFNSKYICYGEVDKEEYYLLIDLETNAIIKKMPITLGFGFIQLFISDELIISYQSRKGLIGLFTLDNQEIWQHNINTLLGTETDSEIKQLKRYNDAIIVASNMGILSIEISTGKVKWAVETYALTIEIVENTGYVCTNSALYKINLDTGVISDYDGWEYSALPDIRYEEKNYTAFGYEVIFHEGLLWYRVFASGESFIIAINPHDGYYEWVQHLEGVDKINSIKFHKNRMYLLDIGGILHVYEKDLK